MRGPWGHAAHGEAMSERACSLCGGPMRARTVRSGLRVRRCDRCVIEHLEDAPADPAALYREGYFRFWPDEPEAVDRQKRTSASWLLDALESATGAPTKAGGAGGAVSDPRRGRLLEVGCAAGALLEVARARGWLVEGLELSPPMVARANERLAPRGQEAGAQPIVREQAFGPDVAAPRSLDAIVFNDVLEHLPDPARALADAHALLSDGGRLLVCTPDLESLSARLLGGRWPHYKLEHLHYFSRSSLRAMLSRAGFRLLLMKDAWKALSLAYVAEHFRVYADGAPARALESVVRRLPGPLKNTALPLVSGNLVAVAERA